MWTLSSARSSRRRKIATAPGASGSAVICNSSWVGLTHESARARALNKIMTTRTEKNRTDAATTRSSSRQRIATAAATKLPGEFGWPLFTMDGSDLQASFGHSLPRSNRPQGVSAVYAPGKALTEFVPVKVTLRSYCEVLSTHLQPSRTKQPSSRWHLSAWALVSERSREYQNQRA